MQEARSQGALLQDGWRGGPLEDRAGASREVTAVPEQGVVVVSQTFR